ncbi:MAG: sigma-70 family RNA polymerase sigma factor [Acidobacteria bacterium]|nr:sigma-70 family RNA polymerase sigma factor [Acidobacteriota bacterium]
MEPIDSDLMCRFQQGDQTAYEELVNRYSVRLHRFLQRLVLNSAVAEELTQDTFLRVFLARERYQASATFSTWIYRIATNLALNWLRDSRHARQAASLEALTIFGTRLQIPCPERTAEENLLAMVNRDRIRMAIEALPERQRLAVILHKYEGMDYEAIARTLGCSVAALKSLLCRAYALLRGRLTAEDEAQNSLPLYIEATYCS